ncbi:UNVERIFIED_CONTAM: hypothetical protein Sangu_2850200 [Sesamum angustifolium]|uniref:Uncharacterized protein n=1 Tax=Sesamum angustifolium TaxID=2727405 RepID=A0AAW2IR17_9LAMI
MEEKGTAPPPASSRCYLELKEGERPPSRPARGRKRWGRRRPPQSSSRHRLEMEEGDRPSLLPARGGAPPPQVKATPPTPPHPPVSHCR